VMMRLCVALTPPIITRRYRLWRADCGGFLEGRSN
jgi:hypothetical protein